MAVFEATHGTAPTIAGQDKANPCSLILSGEMLLRYLGWSEAADRVLGGIQGAMAARQLTFDLSLALGRTAGHLGFAGAVIQKMRIVHV